MATTQNILTHEGLRTVIEIRKGGLDNQLKERIAAERAEMQRIKEQTKERLPGQFISPETRQGRKDILIHRAMAKDTSTNKRLCYKTGNPREDGNKIQVPSV
jgi:hypothetical protein